MWYGTHQCSKWEYKSEFDATKYIPYLALTGELLDVLCKNYEENYRVITAPHCSLFHNIPKLQSIKRKGNLLSFGYHQSFS